VTSGAAASIKGGLDRLLEAAAIDWSATGAGRETIDAAVAHFKTAGPAILEDVTPFLWQYHDSVLNSFSRGADPSRGPRRLPAATDIWTQVSFRHPPELRFGRGRLSPAGVYFSFEGEVSWEPEHGIQLVVEDGVRVGKLGPYDGHITTAHAHGDEALLGVVFRD
jgi:hypothetical protein